MKIVAVQSSPNHEGLTARLAEAALNGAASLGAEIELVNLNDLHLSPCMACGQGWGHHFQPEELPADQCVISDGFAELQAKVIDADGVIFCTPVYFHDLSESARVFLDRLRRCDWPLREKAHLRGKPVVMIAAAGGSGNGALEAATQLEKLLLHFLGMKRVASLAVARINQGLQMDAARSAGKLLVEVARTGS